MFEGVHLDSPVEGCDCKSCAAYRIAHEAGTRLRTLIGAEEADRLVTLIQRLSTNPTVEQILAEKGKKIDLTQLVVPMNQQQHDTYTGFYRKTQSYTPGNQVKHDEGFYICLAPSLNNPPSDARYWKKLSPESRTITPEQLAEIMFDKGYKWTESEYLRLMRWSFGLNAFFNGDKA